MERIGDALKKDKFGLEFKNLLKKHNLSVSEKLGERYRLTNGISEFTVNTQKARSDRKSVV